MRKIITAAALAAMAALAGGCQSAVEDSTASGAAAAPAPAVEQKGQSSAPESIYINNFFKVAVPADWKVVSSDGPDIPAFITLQSKDYQAYVTIRVSRSDLSVDELCQLAAKGFVANGADIVQGPEVKYGTCIIKADAVSRPSVLWLRSYEDGTIYAINFTGEQEKVNEILGRLEGNERMMQLLVMPL